MFAVFRGSPFRGEGNTEPSKHAVSGRYECFLGVKNRILTSESDLLFSRVFSIVSILFAPKNSTLFFYTFSKSIELFYTFSIDPR